MSTGLDLHHVTMVHSSGHRLLDDISLSVARGEILAIIGPAGSGKSVLLKAIAGLIPIESGTILCDGADMVHVGPHKRNVAMTFDNEVIFEHFSVTKNILLGIKHDNISPQEQQLRLDLVAKRLQLQDILSNPINTLSNSQRQRVALARSLIREANLYLLDEPFQNFDRTLRVMMRKMLRDLKHALNRPILFATQNHRHALALADRIAVMERGRVIEIAPPREIYAQPQCLASAQYTGILNLGFQAASLFTDHPSALTACIRPENLSFTGRKSHKFSATIWTIDFLGATTNINVKTSDGQLVSVTVFGPSSYDVGAQVEVYYDPKDVFLFDAAGARVIP